METDAPGNGAGGFPAGSNEGASKKAARPGGLAAGDTYTHEDGLRIRVDRLGVLPQEPPRTMFDSDTYVSAEAIGFEVTVTNDGETTASLSDLNIGVRTGPEGRPADEAWKGTRKLYGKLLPGASATGTYCYRILAGTSSQIDIAITRGFYRSDEGTEQVWTGEAVPGLYDERGTGEGGEPSQARRDELFAEAMSELDAMTGLVAVKQRVQIIGAQARMSVARARHGLPPGSAPHHLVFSGHPGTGKTAVARLLGKIFAGAGLLAKGHLVEAHRVDLIGTHLGQTAVKTSELIDSALDGVLFIDEAYGLHGGYAGSNADAFGDEALQVLLKRAEDDRHRLAVILSGYGQEMDRLLAANPGLGSRFATRVDFPSYGCSELVSIARHMLSAGGDRLNARADAELRRICAEVEACQWQDALGNGRFARTLVENARACRDLRLAGRYPHSDPSVSQLTQIAATDLRSAFEEIRTGWRLRRCADNLMIDAARAI